MKDIDLNKHALCISINDEKYNRLCSWFNKSGITPPELLRSKKINPKGYGVNFGHQLAIWTALERSWPYVIIYEDDAYPCIDIMTEFQNIINEIEQNNIECGVLILGRSGEASGYHDFPGYAFHKQLTEESKKFHTFEGYTSDRKFLSPNIIKIPSNMFGAHAYVVRKEFYNHAINRFYKYQNVADTNLCYPPLKSICTLKCLFIQKTMDNKYWYPCFYENNYTGYSKLQNNLPIGYTEL